MSREDKKKPNRLAHEQSPYLLQHAYNPVDWYAWEPEAFAQAQTQDKPVFLSIGYSTCHWCHVMEKESFEDLEVAELLNASFISVKVDREERPDIDSIYMNVCQMLTQRGGWPLTVFLTPDKKPFYAGTYLPKSNRFGQMGMLELLPRIARLWKERRGELLDSADKIISALQETAKTSPAAELDEKVLHQTYTQLSQAFDETRGGFGQSPKFPIPHHLNFLLRYWRRAEESKALAMVEKTLTAMRQGGIFDHIGFGFHRYSTDSNWLLPHFEKMLYDQALLAGAYIEAFLATKTSLYQKTAEEIFTYVLRDLTSPDGAFFSAEDADSEGIEGKFYTWRTAEIQALLEPQEADLIMQVYNLLPEGNFQEETGTGHTGQNIPHRTRSWEELAQEFKLSVPELKARITSLRKKLFTTREKRVRPLRDEKILTDWNGLMIAALAKGAQAFGKPEFAQAAKRAVDFIWEHMYSPKEGLQHRHKGGISGIPAYADDYAFLIWGIIELYQATFDAKYLQRALDLNRLFLARFWDETNQAFFFTSKQEESLFLRKKESYDGAVPSSNSVAMYNLLRLGRMTGNPELEAQAAAIADCFSGDVSRYPPGYTQLLCALDFSIGPSLEIVIAGKPQAQDTQAMITALCSEFIPNAVVLQVPPGKENSLIKRIAPFTANQKGLKGQATAYVCSHFSCQEPTTDLQDMLKLIRGYIL